MRNLKMAISQAVDEEKKRHHAAGDPVYVANPDGDLCLELPTGELRKLTQTEIEAALS